MDEITDLLGQPYGVGDLIAWPSAANSSSYMSIGRVTKVTYRDKYRQKVTNPRYAVSFSVSAIAEVTSRRRWGQKVSTSHIERTDNIIKVNLLEDNVERIVRANT